MYGVNCRRFTLCSQRFPCSEGVVFPDLYYVERPGPFQVSHPFKRFDARKLALEE